MNNKPKFNLVSFLCETLIVLFLLYLFTPMAVSMINSIIYNLQDITVHYENR